MRYIALIGDLVDSRHIENRKKFQNDLKKSLAEASKNDSVISPYTITLGDEFQALYKSSSGLFSDIVKIMNSIRPIECRIALGIGEITTTVNKKTAIGMDGPAFHLARESMDYLKSEKSLLRISSEKKMTELMINDMLTLISFQMKQWPDSRFAIFSQLMKEYSIEGIAKSIGTSQQAVYKSISQANLRSILDLFRHIETFLEKDYL